MLTMNRATVLGHAGRNPEMRTLPSGDEVALFSLATNERFRRRDGTEGESTEWHAIVAFGNAAQTVRKLVHRGAAVLVEGRMATRTWTDRSGTEHRTSEILVSGPRGRVNVLARRKPEPGDDPPPGGAAAGVAPAKPERTDAVAAVSGIPSSDTAESGAASGVDDAPDRDGKSVTEPDGAGIGGAMVEEAPADGSTATAVGPSSRIEAGPGDDDSSADAAATRLEAAVVGNGDDVADATASEIRGAEEEKAGRPRSEETADVAAAAAAPADTSDESGDAPGAGCAPAATHQTDGGAIDRESCNGAADAEQGNALVQGNTLVDRHA